LATEPFGLVGLAQKPGQYTDLIGFELAVHIDVEAELGLDVSQTRVDPFSPR
jgi:hypothetical protein